MNLTILVALGKNNQLQHASLTYRKYLYTPTHVIVKMFKVAFSNQALVLLIVSHTPHPNIIKIEKCRHNPHGQ